MHLNEWDGNRRQRVAQCDARMGIRTGGNHDKPDAVKFRGVNAINQQAFSVTLETHQVDACLLGLIPQPVVDLGQRYGAVNGGFACAKQIQVRAVQQQYLQHGGQFASNWQKLSSFSPKISKSLSWEKATTVVFMYVALPRDKNMR